MKKIHWFENADKGFHEKWKSGRDMMNLPHPFRALVVGPPNSGKSTVIKNLLIKAKPHFEALYVIHCMADETKEWQDCDPTSMLASIPAPSEWTGEKKTLVVVDDIALKKLPKDEKKNLDRLLGYCSTHMNISVCLTSQDTFNVDPVLRRYFNVYILWPSMDQDSMALIARKVGVKSLSELFEEYCPPGKRNFIMIDKTTDSPYPLRVNGYSLIRQ